VAKNRNSSASLDDDTDERVRRSKEAVLKATYELLSETGLGGVSVDAVCRRSGVAKTTIYRHWPSRTALVLEACSKLGTNPEVPDTGSLRGDLMALALDLARRLKTARWPTVLPSIIDAAERDPEIAGVHARLHAGASGAFRTVVERAQERGEMSNSSDPSEVLAAILGPLFYRRWFSREPLEERFAKAVVERALAAFAEPGPHRRPGIRTSAAKSTAR
jgi:AcrR family transcriptional regulator